MSTIVTKERAISREITEWGTWNGKSSVPMRKAFTDGFHEACWQIVDALKELGLNVVVEDEVEQETITMTVTKQES